MGLLVVFDFPSYLMEQLSSKVGLDRLTTKYFLSSFAMQYVGLQQLWCVQVNDYTVIINNHYYIFLLH